MKLSELEKSEVLSAYNAYWDSYIKGDVHALASLLDDEYTQIGSVESEVFNNKKDAVHFVQSTIHQVAGKVDMRNRMIQLEAMEHSVLITEHSDLYIFIEGEWTYYAKFRASSLMQKKGEHWKFIHQHSSMPDIRAEEGENIATEKIAKENIELRDAIKRRTIELEQKNRELAMESSLERVRAVAMGMRKPDDLLDICEILFNELRNMGFTELRNAMINIHDDEKSSFLNYDFSEDAGKTITHHFYDSHPVIAKQVKQIRSSSDAFSETVFEGKDLDDWKKFRERKGEKKDQKVDSIQALYYYFYSIGTGAIGISTFSSISEEKRNLMKRFRNVFDFAYRRYLDVAQAEAQTREAQIELALERVRARTMAMQRGEELKEVSHLIFQQVRDLGVPTWCCGFNIWEKDDKECIGWMSTEGKLQPSFRVPMTENPTFIRQYDSRQKGEPFYEEKVEGKALVEHYRYMQSLPDFKPILEEFFKAGYTLPESQVNNAINFSHGNLVFITNRPVPEAWDIFKRFASVFQQTYTRFLDLQQAEAQAREATIEASLERVRFQAMAMQNSDDVGLATATMFTELDKLGIENLRCGIAIISPVQTMEVWSAANTDDGKTIGHTGFFNMNDHPLWQHMFKEWSNRGEFFNYYLQGEEKQAYYRILSKTPGYSISQAIHEIPDQHFHAYFFPEGGIWSFSLKPHTDTENQVLQKFAAVFSLTFRRYQDLKKAEAQTKEAQVEAALERVRSKTMAMHNSQDVGNTVVSMFDQLNKLGVKTNRCGILIFSDTNITEVWTAKSNANGDAALIIGYLDVMIHPMLHNVRTAWKNKEHFFSYELAGENLKDYYTAINNFPGYPTRFNLDDFLKLFTLLHAHCSAPHPFQCGFYLCFPGLCFCFL